MSRDMSNLQRGIMLRFMAKNRIFAFSEKGKISVSNQVHSEKH